MNMQMTLELHSIIVLLVMEPKTAKAATIVFLNPSLRALILRVHLVNIPMTQEFHLAILFLNLKTAMAE